MKIKFIPLLFLLGFITAHSQMTTANGVEVVVKPNTLLYSTGDITVKDDTGKVDNYGNIRIKEGTLKSATVADKFNLPYTGIDNYGQLIIDSGLSATGIANVEKELVNGVTYAFFGSPFEGYTFNQFSQDMGTVAPVLPCAPTDYLVCAKAWKDIPVFVWNNDLIRFEPDNSGTFQTGKFYDIRTSKFGGSAKFDTKLTFKGTPNVAKAVAAPIAYSNRINGATPVYIGDNGINPYYVRYYTYVNDPFVTTGPTVPYTSTTTNADLDAAQYANRSVQLINPYTSNIDLKVLTNDFANIYGVGSFGGITTNATSSTRYQGKSQISLVSGGNIAVGDNLQIIPPMTNFFIKGDIDGLNLSFVKPGVQTFANGGYNPNTGIISRKATSNYSNTTNYQINLKLSDASKGTEYSNTFVAAGENFLTGVSKNEASNKDAVKGSTSIYTIPETATGGVDPLNSDARLYINVMNTDAAKVAIPVGIDINTSDRVYDFVITAELAENVIPLAKGQNNFSNPSAKFFFHDKGVTNQNGQIIYPEVVKEIDANFSYSVKLDEESTQNRFEIFWKETGTLGSDEVQTLKGITSVYKTGSEYKVRFDRNWKKAEVSIFSILGQLISSEKNIDTQNDYLLPISGSSSSMYVIKITNEKGETVTKKIVK